MSERLTRVGAWRLVRHLASGGMGTVYLAERDDGQVRQEAAVKILRRELQAEDQVKRFMSERQILASLQHPNIARLLDAGVAPDGRPYFVMEYVPGEPIDLYCDRRKLGIPGRLRLFRLVALAIDYAHHNLVVHRDLKPSNILVTREGQPKLLDFGIAKILEADQAAITLATEPGVRLMTPDYASPEQVLAQTVTTASDVYSLGLLLYELLTGRRAQPVKGKTVAEIERAVLETTAPRPSDAIDTVGDAPVASDAAVPEKAAVARGTTPARLKRTLRGDLDRIVAMATRKEPERRYSSARALADDIDRYLGGDAILARADSAAYRVRKFVRRRWAPVSVAAAAVVMLAVYAVTLTVQSRRVQAALETARIEQAKAEEVTRFLVRLFQGSDPSESRGDTITARDLLARGVGRIDTLDGQPLVQGQLLDVIGRVYENLGQFDQAEPLVRRALDVRRRTRGDTHPDVADSLTHVGTLAALRGRLAEAEDSLRRALALHQAAHGPEHPTVATDLHELGAVIVDRGNHEEGRRLFEQALAMRRRLLGPQHDDIAESLSGLAYAASQSGDYAEMERRHREALAMRRQIHGENHPLVALAMNNVAAALNSRGQYEAAEAMHREALALRRKLFGDEHPAVATSMNNLAQVLLRRERNAEGLALFERVVEMRRRLLGPEHPSTATALNNVAVAALRNNRPEEAEKALLEARAIWVKHFGERHPSVAGADANLSTIVLRLGRRGEAEQLARRSLETRKALFGDRHPDIASSLITLAKALDASGRGSEAQPLAEQAVEIRRAALGAEHPDTRRAQEELAGIRRTP